jgi:hypothetical protein
MGSEYQPILPAEFGAGITYRWMRITIALIVTTEIQAVCSDVKL